MEEAMAPDRHVTPALLTSKLRCVRKKHLLFNPFFGVSGHSQLTATLCFILDLSFKCCPTLPTFPGPLDAPRTLNPMGRVTLLGHGLGKSFLLKTLHL